MTKVACKYRQRLCLLKCNREVTWISGRGCAYCDILCGITVLPETIDPFTEVLPWPIGRSTPRSRLGNDAACQNFTEVLPRFAAT